MSEVLQVHELLLDPKWKVFPIQIGGDHGGTLIVLRLEHPRFGNIDCQINPDSAELMRAGLKTALNALGGVPFSAPSVRMQ
jgi:hypothetical protein